MYYVVNKAAINLMYSVNEIGLSKLSGAYLAEELCKEANVSYSDFLSSVNGKKLITDDGIDNSYTNFFYTSSAKARAALKNFDINDFGQSVIYDKVVKWIARRKAKSVDQIKELVKHVYETYVLNPDPKLHILEVFIFTGKIIKDTPTIKYVKGGTPISYIIKTFSIHEL